MSLTVSLNIALAGRDGAAISPGLAVNFTSGTLDPRITFTRATSGTYVNSSGVLITAPIDTPRFDHDPTTLAARGLLIEGQRTNLLLYSENLSGAAWTKTGTPVLDAAIVDPAGNTGTVYYPTVSEITQTFNGGNSTTISFSFFAKKRTGSSNDRAVFQFFQQTSAPATMTAMYNFEFTAANPDATYVKNVIRTAYPNGWYRFTCQLLANTGAGSGSFTSTARVDLEGANSTNYTWGLQVEAATFATSYIPTVAAQVTRGADSASMTGSNFSSWYNQLEGTIYHESLAYSPGQPYFLIDDTTTNNSISSFCGTGAAGQRTLLVIKDTVTQVAMDGVDTLANSFAKSASGLKSSNFGNSTNGQPVTTATSGVIPNVSRIVFGGNGTIRRFAYYQRRLFNAQLQALTE